MADQQVPFLRSIIDEAITPDGSTDDHPFWESAEYQFLYEHIRDSLNASIHPAFAATGITYEREGEAAPESEEHRVLESLKYYLDKNPAIMQDAIAAAREDWQETIRRDGAQILQGEANAAFAQLRTGIQSLQDDLGAPIASIAGSVAATLGSLSLPHTVRPAPQRADAVQPELNAELQRRMDEEEPFRQHEADAPTDLGTASDYPMPNHYGDNNVPGVIQGIPANSGIEGDRVMADQNRDHEALKAADDERALNARERASIDATRRLGDYYETPQGQRMREIREQRDAARAEAEELRQENEALRGATVTGAEGATTSVTEADAEPIADKPHSELGRALQAFVASGYNSDKSDDLDLVQTVRKQLGIKDGVDYTNADQTTKDGSHAFISQRHYDAATAEIEKRIADGDISEEDIEELRTTFQNVQLTHDTAGFDDLSGSMSAEDRKQAQETIARLEFTETDANAPAPTPTPADPNAPDQNLEVGSR